MSRTQALILLVVATLTSCGAVAPQEPSAPPPPPSPDTLAYRAVRNWLTLVQAVDEMGTAEVLAELAVVGLPENDQALFYFGLLNQKLDTYSSWTQARDAFREVGEETDVTPEQQQLADFMASYNQSRINWYLANQKLQEDVAAARAELQAAQQEIRLMQQKIQAITELETSISTRKEP